jgi:hypothetical protein
LSLINLAASTQSVTSEDIAEIIVAGYFYFKMILIAALIPSAALEIIPPA